MGPVRRFSGVVISCVTLGAVHVANADWPQSSEVMPCTQIPANPAFVPRCLAFCLVGCRSMLSGDGGGKNLGGDIGVDGGGVK